MDLTEQIKNLAIKHNLTQSEIKKIWKSQFKYTAHVMSLDFNTKEINERRSIKLKGFGTFAFLKYKAEIITKRKQEKDERTRNLAEKIAEN